MAWCLRRQGQEIERGCQRPTRSASFGDEAWFTTPAPAQTVVCGTLTQISASAASPRRQIDYLDEPPERFSGSLEIARRTGAFADYAFAG